MSRGESVRLSRLGHELENGWFWIKYLHPAAQESSQSLDAVISILPIRRMVVVFTKEVTSISEHPTFSRFVFLFAVVDYSSGIDPAIASIEYSSVIGMDLEVQNGFTQLVVKEGQLVFESNSLYV